MTIQMRPVVTHFKWTRSVTRCTQTRELTGSPPSTDVDQRTLVWPSSMTMFGNTFPVPYCGSRHGLDYWSHGGRGLQVSRAGINATTFYHFCLTTAFPGERKVFPPPILAKNLWGLMERGFTSRISFQPPNYQGQSTNENMCRVVPKQPNHVISYVTKRCHLSKKRKRVCDWILRLNMQIIVKQVSQLSLTHPRDALHHGKWPNLRANFRVRGHPPTTVVVRKLESLG